MQPAPLHPTEVNVVTRLNAPIERSWTRRTFVREETSANEHAKALAALARWGGEDAAEGMRKTAGDEHVERYLHLEGDDTWIGKSGEIALDRDTANMMRDGTRESIDSAIEMEKARLARVLDPTLHPEVPSLLRTEQAPRIRSRLDTLEGGL